MKINLDVIWYSVMIFLIETNFSYRETNITFIFFYFLLNNFIINTSFYKHWEDFKNIDSTHSPLRKDKFHYTHWNWKKIVGQKKFWNSD